jgi:ABC-type Fe3+/spermidine/putrescine transport system ATPase subunit
MPFLEVTDIHKTYENAPLLRGVTFEVAQGEITSLLGPSGSGKTTLLRIIAGLEHAERGQMILEGQALSQIPPHERNIVLMFQDYALFPHRTVAENVAFGLRMRGESRTVVEARVAEMLELVGMEKFHNRDVNELSGGERQRVALARSLAPQPRLLLLDEPLGALDRNLRERLLEDLPAILRRVSTTTREGVTTVTVTHDQEEAFAMADHVVLLHQGRVVQAGRPDAIYNAPATAWVARFLGLDNLLPAIVVTTTPPCVEVPFGILTLSKGRDLPSAETEGTLLIHPWGIHLHSITSDRVIASDPSNNNDEANTFSAQVQRRTFHGWVYELTLTLQTDDADKVARASKELRLFCEPRHTLPEVGATVTGWIEPDAIQWL